VGSQTGRLDKESLRAGASGSLSPQRILALYRQKDGVEQCFKVTKSELEVSPIYLHKDDRIQAMLLINILALLALQPAGTPGPARWFANDHTPHH
jgi:transposase